MIAPLSSPKYLSGKSKKRPLHIFPPPLSPLCAICLEPSFYSSYDEHTRSYASLPSLCETLRAYTRKRRWRTEREIGRYNLGGKTQTAVTRFSPLSLFLNSFLYKPLSTSIMVSHRRPETHTYRTALQCPKKTKGLREGKGRRKDRHSPTAVFLLFSTVRSLRPISPYLPPPLARWW